MAYHPLNSNPSSTSLIPLNRLLARLLPRDVIDVHRSETRNQSERNSRPSPQAVEVPVQAEASAERYWHGDLFVVSQSDDRSNGVSKRRVLIRIWKMAMTYHVVREKVDVTTNLLLAQATEQTVADSCQRIEELESGAKRQHSGSKTNNVWVAGVQAGDVVAEDAKQRHIQNSEHGADDVGHASRHAGSIRQSGTDEVSHARAGCDAKGER